MKRSVLLSAVGGTLLVPQRGRAQSLVKIRAGAATNDSYAEPYFGIAQGFFTKQGLDVEVSVFFNAQATVQALVANAIDVGLADMIQVVNPIERGIPLAYFAGGGLYRTERPATLLCVAKSSDIRSAKDLEGKAVAVVSLTSISSASVQDWLVRGGADLANVKLYEMSFASMPPALIRGTVAAAFVAEPFVSESKDDIRILASTYDTIAKQFYVGAWFAYRNWLTQERAVAKRFVDALYQTAQWSNTHHDDTALILSNIGKMKLENVRAMARTDFATSLDPKLLQPVIDIAVKHRLIEHPISANDIVVRV